MQRLEQRPNSVQTASPAASPTASGSRKALSPEAAQLQADILAGKTVTDIAKERNGGSTSGNYRHILAEVNTLLREAMGDEDL